MFVTCTDNNQQLGVFISKEWLTIDTDCNSTIVYGTGLKSNGREIEPGQIKKNLTYIFQTLTTRILVLGYFIKCILDVFMWVLVSSEISKHKLTNSRLYGV